MLSWVAAMVAISPTGLSAQGVCDRTPQVRDELVEATGVSTCGDVTQEHLAGVTTLELSDSGIDSLQEQDFVGLSELTSLWLNNNSLRDLPEGVFSGLNSLEFLWLHGNLLDTLPEGLFSELTSLEALHLYNNSLTELPEGIFNGLNSLRTIHLYNNSLTELPEGVFGGLNGLERLELWGNNLGELPKGIFDDILETLDSGPGYEGFFVDFYLKARPAFASTTQYGLKGTSVSASVTLSRPLPVALRVPYSVGGSASVDNYADLSPAPETGLLFLAGETSKEITFTLSEEEDSRRETVVLTLGELSQMGLRRSDGSEPDAPHLRAETLVERVPATAIHTVAVSGRDPVSAMAGVCGRTLRIRDELMMVTGVSACEDVTDEHLASVTRLEMQEANINALQENDFIGLSSLKTLILSRNNLSFLPEGVFSELSGLEGLYLDGNSFSTVPEGAFGGLVSLTTLWLNHNGLTAIPEGAFSGLSSLEWLRLTRNSLTTLPEGVFSGLSSLQLLGLSINSLTELPQEIFSGLNSLETLQLNSNSLTSLPQGIFSGLSSLEWLTLSSNSLTELTEEVFSGLPALKVLRLNGNPLESLPQEVFNGIDGLEWLEMLGTPLTTLPEEIFNGMSNLRSLSLGHNSLAALPEAIFDGLHNLEDLSLLGNSLTTLPEGIFQGLSKLRFLSVRHNALTILPAEIFRGLSSLEMLWLSGNSLSLLPEKSFRGLNRLERLWLDQNSLTSLPDGVFAGLTSVKELKLSGNNLNELPKGVFDDMLGTLGQDIELKETAYSLFFPIQGGLYLDGHLKAWLGFASTGQSVTEGSTVRAPVTLSRPLPVAVRVPYTVGFSGASGGLTGLSPVPESGLVFPAGATLREISFTLPTDDDTQQEGIVVLNLGQGSLIGLRRSGGSEPDAPNLKTEHLIYTPGTAVTHTVTVSDFDRDDQEPFCLSLWEGSPCAAVATFSPSFMGPRGEKRSKTEVVITNKDPQPAGCETALLFHQGTSPAPSILFNEQFLDGNLLYATIPAGGAEVLTLTAPAAQPQSVGAVYVFTRSPCTADSLHVRGSHLVEDQAVGAIEELFSLNGQSSEDWLENGDCRVLTGVIGDGRALDLASVTAQPEVAAPPGTRLHLREFDLKGNFLGVLPSLEISGKHRILSPFVFEQPRRIQMCLEVPGAGNFKLALTPIGTKSAGMTVQYATEGFPLHPGSGEVSPSP